MLSNNKRKICGDNSELNSKTQMQKVWKAIRKVKGKGGSNSVNRLKVKGKLITDKKEVAEALAINLSKNSSTDSYSSEFLRKSCTKP